MIDVTIKSKCYDAITTCIDGITVRIPPKNKVLRISISKVTEHMEELIKENKIQVIIN